jgi:hypothetical protein
MKNKLSALLLIVFPIVIFFVFVWHYAVNIGYADDFHGIEGFLASWMQQDTWQDKARLLFSQMCEHRILYGRSSTLLSKALFGEINYKFLMLSGVAYLLVLPFVFYQVLRQLNLGLAYLIPVVFIVFNIQPIENIFWAMTVLQPNITLIFGVWALYLVIFTTKPLYFYAAIFLCFVSMFTNGNGMFSYLAALPAVWYVRSKSEKIQWVSVMLLCFLGYFYEYQKPGIRPDVVENFVHYPHLIVGDFFAFFGSPIDSTVLFYNIFLKNTTAILAGLAMVSWLAVLLFTFAYFEINPKSTFVAQKNWFLRLYERMNSQRSFNLFLLTNFIFVSLSGAAFAVSRASQGLEQAFMTRYKSVALILFVLFYLSFFNLIKLKNWAKYLNVSIVLALLFNLFSYYASFDDVANYRKFLATTMINWQNNGRYFYYRNGTASRYPDDHAPITSYQKLPIPPLNYAGYVPGIMKYVNDILYIGRVHFKNYTPPAELTVLNNALFANKDTTVLSTNETEVIEEPNAIKVTIRNAKIPVNQMYGAYYAVFKNQNHKMVFVLNNQANKFATFLSQGVYYNSMIETRVSKPELPAGNFKMEIGRLENGSFEVLHRQTILIR